jgi:hypothetical protein
MAISIVLNVGVIKKIVKADYIFNVPPEISIFPVRALTISLF